MTDYKYWEKFDEENASREIDRQDDQKSFREANIRGVQQAAASNEAIMIGMKKSSEILQSKV